MRIDARPAVEALASLDAAGTAASKAASIDVGWLFHRGRIHDVQALLGEATTQAQAARDAVAGAGLTQASGQLDGAVSTLQGAAGAAASGARKAAKSTAVGAVPATFGEVAAAVRGAVDLPADAGEVLGWASTRATAVRDVADARAFASEVEAARSLRPGLLEHEPLLRDDFEHMTEAALQRRVAEVAIAPTTPAGTRDELVRGLDATATPRTGAQRYRFAALVRRETQLPIGDGFRSLLDERLARDTAHADEPVVLDTVRRALVLDQDAGARATRLEQVTAAARASTLTEDDVRDAVAIAASREPGAMPTALEAGSLASLLARSGTTATGRAITQELARADVAALPAAEVASSLETLLATSTTSALADGDRYRASALAMRLAGTADSGVDPQLAGLAARRLGSDTPPAADDAAVQLLHRTMQLAVPGTASTTMRNLVDSAALGPLSDEELRDLAAIGSLTGANAPARPAFKAAALRDVVTAGGDLTAGHALVDGKVATYAFAGVADRDAATRVLQDAARAGTADEGRLRTVVAQSLLLPEHLRPTDGVDDPAVRAQLEAGAKAVLAGEPVRPNWPGWSRIDGLAAAATYGSADAAAARAGELLGGGDVREMDAAHLRELRGLASLPESLRPAGLPTVDLAPAIESAMSERPTIRSDWEGWNDLLVAQSKVRFPTPDAARTAAVDLLTSTAPTARTAEQWRTLAAAARQLPDGLGGMDAAGLDAMAQSIHDGNGQIRGWAGWNQLDGFVAGRRYATRAAADASLSVLLQRPPGSWTSTDWHDLQGIALLPDDRRPAAAIVRDDLGYQGARLDAGSQVDAYWDGWPAVRAAAAQERYPTIDSARDAAVAMLERGPGTLDADGWDQLAIAQARLETAAETDESVRHMGIDASTMTAVATGLRENGNPLDGDMLGRLDAWHARARFTTRDAATARALQLLDRPLATLKPEELDALHGLSALPDEVRPSAFPKGTDFAGAASSIRQGYTFADSVGRDSLTRLGGFQFSNGIGGSRLLAKALTVLGTPAATVPAGISDAERASLLLGRATDDLDLLGQLSKAARVGEVRIGGDAHLAAMRGLADRTGAELDEVRPLLATSAPEHLETVDAATTALQQVRDSVDGTMRNYGGGTAIDAMESGELSDSLRAIDQLQVHIATTRGQLDETSLFERETAEAMRTMTATTS